MHVLGHSFSQKRKCTKRPRDLHIRKISFSGSSLSDGSLSSSTSTVSAYTALPTPQHHMASPIMTSPSQTAAPLRLHERPFKSSRSPSTGRTTTTFYDDTAVSDDDEDLHYSYYYDGGSGKMDEAGSILEVEGTQFHMELPPHAEHIETDTPQAADQCEPADYFFFQHVVSKRPPMPGSRWSESTIQTLNEEDMTPSTAQPTPICDEGDYDLEEDEEDEDDDSSIDEPLEMPARQVRLEALPNFSHKYQRTVSAPEARRPPMRTMDSVDDFIKRGGWKRRGIVFDRREVGMRDSDCFTVI